MCRRNYNVIFENVMADLGDLVSRKPRVYTDEELENLDDEEADDSNEPS